jgi:3-dehydroquinate dehydratase-2
MTPPASPAASRTVLVLNGPNLNLLGTREPEVYGRTTLAEIDRVLVERGHQAGISVQTFQSNHEGELVDRIQQAGRDRVDWILVNAGAFTHTSVALRDALSAVAIPFIEVHLSNVFAREAFRHHSYLSDIAVGVVSGLGAGSYRAALDHAIATLTPGK